MRRFYALGETFNAIVTEANKRMGGEAALKFKYKEEIKNIYENEFPAAFIKARDENQRRKLGLLSFNSGDSQDKDLWIQLESLLYRLDDLWTHPDFVIAMPVAFDIS